MGPLAPEIEHQYFRVVAVDREIGRLRWSAAYSGAARLLLDVLRDALARVVREFATLASGTPGQIRIARRYGQIASAVHDCLQFIEGSDEEHAPSSLVEPLETLARKYLPPCQLLVRGSFEGGLGGYWCEFVVGGLRLLLRDLTDGDELLGRLKGLVSLVFPSAERHNLLMHAILGHELGHSFSYDLGLLEKLVLPLPRDIIAQLPDEQAQRRLVQVAFDWEGELIADTWGIHIMGPAYYFASRSALAPTPPSDDHPSGRFRLELLCEQLEKRGYFGLEGEAGECLQAEGLQQTQGTDTMAEGDAVYLAAEKLLSGAKPDIFGIVEKQPKAFTPERFAGVAWSLTERLCNLVPPDETDGVPAEMPDVLNAGWLVRLRRWEYFCCAVGAKDDPARRFDALSKLNNLLLKALEYSAVRTHWQAAS